MPKEDPVGPGGGADQDWEKGYVPKNVKKKETKGQKTPRQNDDEIKDPRKIESYKKGGTVKKTGLAVVHKGERVIPAKKETATARFIRLRNEKERKGRQ